MGMAGFHFWKRRQNRKKRWAATNFQNPESSGRRKGRKQPKNNPEATTIVGFCDFWKWENYFENFEKRTFSACLASFWCFFWENREFPTYGVKTRFLPQRQCIKLAFLPGFERFSGDCFWDLATCLDDFALFSPYGRKSGKSGLRWLFLGFPHTK